VSPEDSPADVCDTKRVANDCTGQYRRPREIEVTGSGESAGKHREPTVLLQQTMDEYTPRITIQEHECQATVPNGSRFSKPPGKVQERRTPHPGFVHLKNYFITSGAGVRHGARDHYETHVQWLAGMSNLNSRGSERENFELCLVSREQVRRVPLPSAEHIRVVRRDVVL